MAERIEKAAIAAAHFVLLYWIYFTLTEAGRMSVAAVFGHFTGMSLFGGILIFTTAYRTKRRYFCDLRSRRVDR